MEGMHCREDRRNIYLACEELNFVWDLEEVIRFDERWKAGASLLDLAEEFGRKTEEVALLIIDRAKRGKIYPRANGVFGL
jgi:hypothetical protein